jgi:hypothetical protein
VSEDCRYTWCPVCRRRTFHEDGVCDNCGRMLGESIIAYENRQAEEMKELLDSDEWEPIGDMIK